MIFQKHNYSQHLSIMKFAIENLIAEIGNP